MAVPGRIPAFKNCQIKRKGGKAFPHASKEAGFHAEICMKTLVSLSSWCYNFVTLRVLIAGVLVCLFFVVAILPYMDQQLIAITGIHISPDTSFFYSAQDIYSMAESYGAEGRSYYIQTRYTFDVVWPIAYLLFLSSFISIIFRFSPPDNHWRLINLIPFAGVLFDFLENGAASIVMYRYPFKSPIIAELAPFFTLFKWVFIGASFFVLIIGICLLIIRVTQRLVGNVSSK